MTSEITWEMRAWSRAKHEILARYLSVWLPIVGAQFQEVLYCDGFAGPGEYAGGEMGSPVVALQAANRHVQRNRPARCNLAFFEKDPDRAENLRRVLAAHPRVEGVRWKVVSDEFATAFPKVLNWLDQQREVVPTFALVDPFGVDGLPIELVRGLMDRPVCEVMITLMTGFLGRFAGEWENKLPELMGSTDVLEEIRSAPSRNRCDVALESYAAALGRSARHVLPFRMRNDRDDVVYDLVFATNAAKGLVKMKEAMWGTAPAGDFASTVASRSGQGMLMPFHEVEARELLVRKFAARTVSGREVRQWIELHTMLLNKHKTTALRELEQQGLATVAQKTTDGGTRRRNTYPDRSEIHFSEGAITP